MELVQEHFKLDGCVQLLERLLDLVTIGKQDFGHLDCFFGYGQSAFSDLLTYQLQVFVS